MNQNTQPAPFNLGDHVRYVSTRRRALPSGPQQERELVLTRGMEGVILLSTGALSGLDAAAPNPWHCRAQFQNGFQVDITPDNVADFEAAHSPVSDSV